MITQQLYIEQLVRALEGAGLVPVPIFINGVEAHQIVRDQLTSATEQAAIAAGSQQRGSLRRDAAPVDAIVSTIGFPLVGGPAGATFHVLLPKIARAMRYLPFQGWPVATLHGIRHPKPFPWDAVQPLP